MSEKSDATVKDQMQNELLLDQALHELIEIHALKGPGFLNAIIDLVEEHGPLVYSDLLYLLCRLTFKPAEAEKHWQKILKLCALMQLKLEREVDLRVALVDYFMGQQEGFEHPILIELQTVEQMRSSAFCDSLTGLCLFRRDKV